MVAADVAKAEKARAEGNASFKKGRWVEAIGHYTAAIVANPDDAIPYTNRAAAYLKLDKYEDAERDCTSALERQPGHLKALYRRGLARKGQERYEEAISDLEAVLTVEKNEMASNELDGVRDLLREQEENARRKKQAKARLPPSPPRASASIEELPDDESSEYARRPPASSEGDQGSTEGTSSAKVDSVSLTDQGIAAPKPKGTFADMRKSRTDRKTYITPSSALASAPVASSPTTAAPQASVEADATPNGEALPSSKPSKYSSDQAALTPATAQAPKRPAPSPPADPTSTSPSAGFHLLNTISRLKAEETWAYLLHYPPAVLAKILSSLLEPESLGQILLALRHGVDTDQDRVRAILKGLRCTSRWKINVAMLERAEAQVGREIWELCQCQGTFE